MFRDRDELPGASDLGAKLREELQRSRYLIVVCSANDVAVAIADGLAAQVKTGVAEIGDFDSKSGVDVDLLIGPELRRDREHARDVAARDLRDGHSRHRRRARLRLRARTGRATNDADGTKGHDWSHDVYPEAD